MSQQDYLNSIGKQSKPTTYTLEGAYVKGKGKRAKTALLVHTHTNYDGWEEAIDSYYSVYTEDGTAYSVSPLLKDAQDKMAARGFKYNPARTAELTPPTPGVLAVLGNVTYVAVGDTMARTVNEPVVDSEATNGEMGVVVQGKTIAEWTTEGQANELRDPVNHVHPDFETSVYELKGREKEAYLASCTERERELYANLGVIASLGAVRFA